MLLFLLLLLLSSTLGTATLNHTTDIWLAELAPGTSPHLAAERLGMSYVGSLVGGRYHAFRQKLARQDSIYTSSIARMLSSDRLVTWYEHQVARQQVKKNVVPNTLGDRVDGYLRKRYGKNGMALVEERMARMHQARVASTNAFFPVDPLYYLQWHLKGASPANVRASETWDRHESYRGNQFSIGIVDDGLNHGHPDIAPNYDPVCSWDFNGDQGHDPMPDHHDTHGTAAAGVAAAASNNVCGLGACPNCKISGLRLIAGPSSDYMEANALSFHIDVNGIFSNSWGPVDDGRTMAMPGRVTREAIAHNVARGRRGRGTLYVWAGGNGGANSDNGNYDGYANNRHVIAVGAVDYHGKKAYYSEPCACLTVSAPSSGTAGKGITTTYFDYDMHSTCTNSFGGTSSAAPLVSGALGVLLGKFPDLTKRDVVMLLGRTSTITDETDGDWTPRNAMGVRHNHKYGYGIVNMYELTREAVLWQRLPPQVTCTTGKRNVNHFMADAGGEFTINMGLPSNLISCDNGGSTGISVVESVELQLWVQHGSRGDLQVILKDPARVASYMHVPHADRSSFPDEGWTYSSARHLGQNGKGVWTLSVGDATRNGISGRLLAFQLNVYGH
jgi:kexin